MVLLPHCIELTLAEERDHLSTLPLQLTGLFPNCVLVQPSPPLHFSLPSSMTPCPTHTLGLDGARRSDCFLSQKGMSNETLRGQGLTLVPEPGTHMGRTSSKWLRPLYNRDINRITTIDGFTYLLNIIKFQSTISKLFCYIVFVLKKQYA